MTLAELGNDITNDIRQRLDGLDEDIIDDVCQIVLDNIADFQKE